MCRNASGNHLAFRERQCQPAAKALSAAKTAVEKVNQQIKSAGESATRDTKALQAKVTADVNALKAHVVEAKHGLDVN